MNMKEIVIVTRNRAGLLADVSESLASRGINIETLNAEEVHGMAILELTVNRYDEALQILRNAGFDAVTEDAIVIRLRDEPGALAKVARRFKDANIDIRSLRIILRQEGSALVALATTRPGEARALVKDYLANG
ncbi:MAG: ACT domain-containing protein [Bryobacteraceae bacterium]|nr:ACT domain-containing protein [Bryobacteraceae bacterium]